jgi:hypothetical protein
MGLETRKPDQRIEFVPRSLQGHSDTGPSKYLNPRSETVKAIKKSLDLNISLEKANNGSGNQKT